MMKRDFAEGTDRETYDTQGRRKRYTGIDGDIQRCHIAYNSNI